MNTIKNNILFLYIDILKYSGEKGSLLFYLLKLHVRLRYFKRRELLHFLLLMERSGLSLFTQTQESPFSPKDHQILFGDIFRSCPFYTIISYFLFPSFFYRLYEIVAFSTSEYAYHFRSSQSISSLFF